MSDQIRHEGIVESIDGEHLRVRIVQQSACTSCKLAKSCLTSESKVKMVDVWTKEYEKYMVGQEVMVEITGKIGAMAVVLGFVVPTILVLLTVIASLYAMENVPELYVAEPNCQAYAALLGLLALIPYYLLLYAFRAAIKQKVTFRLLTVD